MVVGGTGVQALQSLVISDNFFRWNPAIMDLIFTHYIPIGPCSCAALCIPERWLSLFMWVVNDKDIGMKYMECGLRLN